MCSSVTLTVGGSIVPFCFTQWTWSFTCGCNYTQEINVHDDLCASFCILAVQPARQIATHTHRHRHTNTKICDCWSVPQCVHAPAEAQTGGLSFSGRNCKLQCIFVLGPRWIYLVATFCKEGGVAFQQETQEKRVVEGGWGHSLSRCIVFRKMPVWISVKSTFPLAETTVGWGLLVQLSNHILCKTSVVALCLISSLPNDTSTGMACL